MVDNNRQFEKIEEKLRKSFSEIKQDILELKDSIEKIRNNFEEDKQNIERDKKNLEQEIKQLKDRKEKSTQKETEKLERNIIDLTNYVSELRQDILELKENQDKQSEVKDLIEFNELKSQISDLKESIDHIKFPEQKDNSKEFLELTRKLSSELETLRKEVKAIKIPKQQDYSQDINDLAKEIGELKGSLINKKYLDKEISRTKEQIEDKLKGIENKQQEFKHSIEKKTKQPLVLSLKNEVKQLKSQIEEETEKYENFLSEAKEENRKIRQEIKSENEELKSQITALKGKITRLFSATPEEKKEIIEKERLTENTKQKIFQISKIAIIIIPLILIGYILYSNFIAAHDFNYFYDIGKEQDAKTSYLTPTNRISNVDLQEETNYRNLTAGLVYFDVPIPRGSDNLTIEFRFKNNFPKKSKLTVGARVAQDWNYTYNLIFNDSSKNFNNKGQWLTAQTQFNLKDLYINNGKLSMLFNVPHLAENKNQTNMMHIPIDWINITVHKDGIF